ncbi:MAG: ATP-dependent DNA helicase RecQ [Verrucomicrobiota bacterium]
MKVGSPERTPDPRRALQEHFGFSAFREGQQEVVSLLLEGHSVLAILPTGGGKSLCYQLPALLLPGLTVVVSPLLALMKDQVDGLQARGIPAARLDSSLSPEEVMAVWQALEEGGLRLLYVAPERLGNASFRERLAGKHVSLLAIDEAHCVSEWGHNFRPDYLKLGRWAKRGKVDRVLALTATATPSVAREVRKAFGIRKAEQVQTSFRQANLSFGVTPCETGERLERLAERLERLEGPAVVYVTLQRTAEEVAHQLRAKQFKARAYHAGMRAEDRAELQEAFLGNEVRIMVATIAFGMGIDKPDIRAVFHYNLPKTLENYVQECGRAGRDGEMARCELFACGDDRRVLENFIHADTPSPKALEQLLRTLLRSEKWFHISLYELSHSLDLRPTVIETVIAYLERRGLLESKGSFWKEYRLRPLSSVEKMVAGRSGQEARLVRRLFELGETARTWTTIEVEEVASGLNLSPSRLRALVTSLQESGEVAWQQRGFRKEFLRRGEVENWGHLLTDFRERFSQREEREESRFQRVVDYAESRACLVKQLLAYFGERGAKACGTCSSCLGERKGPRRLPTSPTQEISQDLRRRMTALVEENLAPLRTGRQLARFLAGISSPATTRTRLSHHDLFGSLSELGFREILAEAEGLVGS